MLSGEDDISEDAGYFSSKSTLMIQQREEHESSQPYQVIYITATESKVEERLESSDFQILMGSGSSMITPGVNESMKSLTTKKAGAASLVSKHTFNGAKKRIPQGQGNRFNFVT